MSGFVYLAIAFVTNAIANVLLKVGADKGASLDLSLGVGKLLAHNAFLIGGALLFAFNLVFYVAALRSLPLSVAYPIMVGMSFLIANAVAFLFLDERIGGIHILGYALILAGITLIVSAFR